MLYTRRDVGKLALASVPLSAAFGAKINSKIGGVQIGAISYSFNTLYNNPATQDPMAIVKAYVDIGLGECELMSNHCEALAGAPAVPAFGGFGGGGGGGGRAAGGAAAAGRGPGGAPGGAAAAAPAGAPTPMTAPAPDAAAAGRGQGRGQGRGAGGGGRTPLTPEQLAARDEAQKKLTDWRAAATAATWKAVTRKFNDAGITLAVLCYNMRDEMKDDDIEFGFKMAEGLGVKYISTSTTLTMAKRIAPIADKHKLMVGYHGHDQTNDPNETATLESYDKLMAYGKYNGINLDIGHFTAANYDAVDFIAKHHDRITNLHIKDRKKDHGPNVFPWGAGDTPIKPVLQLLKKNKYPFPANMELEGFPRDQDVVALAKECFAYVKKCLA
jgi:sugar phosphate isomerase/epimerase